MTGRRRGDPVVSQQMSHWNDVMALLCTTVTGPIAALLLLLFLFFFFFFIVLNER